MQKHHISVEQALSQVRQARSIAEPNDGFMKQLGLYGQMVTPDNVEASPIYQRWVYQREIELSRACGQAPEPVKIRFEDEHVTDEGAEFELKCRKCRSVEYTLGGQCRSVTDFTALWCSQRLHRRRRPLAASRFLVEHGSTPMVKDQSERSSPDSPSQNCAHYFLDPLSWMRPELEQGKLDGRFECPKCRTNVGKYAWQGMQCSCGEWIVPGISLSKSRVDQVKKRAVAEIRRPPGATLPPPAAQSGPRQTL